MLNHQFHKLNIQMVAHHKFDITLFLDRMQDTIQNHQNQVIHH